MASSESAAAIPVGTDQPDSLPDVPAKRLELPNHTKEHNKISSAWLGTGTGPCLNTGPSRETQEHLLMSAMQWTALPTPWTNQSCYPGWALDGSLVAAPSLSGVMIDWWRWRRPTLSENMMRLSAPLRASELIGSTEARPELDLHAMD